MRSLVRSTPLLAAVLLAACAPRAWVQPELTVAMVPRTMDAGFDPASPEDTVEWVRIVPVRLQEDRVDLRVANQSGTEVVPLWWEARFLGFDGVERPLATRPPRSTRGAEPELPLRVGAGAVVGVRLAPTQPSHFPETVRDSMAAQALCEELGGREMRVTLPMQRGGVTRVYTLRVTADAHLRILGNARVQTFDCARSHLVPGLGPG